MKVKTLIKELVKMTQEQEVVYCGDGNWTILEVTNYNGQVQLQN